jgi:Ca2+-binding RTX toxin-like protein
VTVNGDAIAGVTETSTGSPIPETVLGGPYPIVPSAAAGTGLSNYTISYHNGLLTVNPAPLTITADNKSMIKGDLLPPLTASYSGFVNGDTPASLTSPAILSTTATSQSAAGPYTISARGAADSNYRISYTAGTMTVISDVGKAVLIPDPINPTQTLLSISGTSANDVILINSGAPGYVTVTYDGRLLGSFNPTSRIRVHGGGGNDTISVSQSVKVPVWLYADNGNAQLQGGGGPTLLMGGSGKDTLWGGTGRTIMIGGSGVSSLIGGTGDAIMIGGKTDYDTNDLALQSLLTIWGSPVNNYATRVSQITSTNAAYPLNASTVINERVVDHLLGGAGTDFFFQLPGDLIQNSRPGETVLV